MTFHLSPRLYPSTTGCSPQSVFHRLLCVAFLFHFSPRLFSSIAGCSPQSMSCIAFCLLLSCFTFHLGFVHPLQDLAPHQYLPLSCVCCFPVPGGSLLLRNVFLPSSASFHPMTYVLVLHWVKRLALGIMGSTMQFPCRSYKQVYSLQFSKHIHI